MPQSVIAVLPNSCDSKLISESLGRDGIAVMVVPSPEEALLPRIFAVRPKVHATTRAAA
jgi:hypothetical protein